MTHEGRRSEMRSGHALRNRATSVDFIRRKACHTPLERLAERHGTGNVPNFHPETNNSSAILRRYNASLDEESKSKLNSIAAFRRQIPLIDRNRSTRNQVRKRPTFFHQRFIFNHVGR